MANQYGTKAWAKWAKTIIRNYILDKGIEPSGRIGACGDAIVQSEPHSVFWAGEL